MPHKDPDAARAYNREYKRANRWRYRRRQKAYDAAAHANEKAARLGVTGIITAEDVEAVLAAGRCGHCHRAFDYLDLELDHVIPFSEPTCTNTPENLTASCEQCNARKQAKPTVTSWARGHEACVECGTTDRPHRAHGLCQRCHSRRYDREHPERRRKGPTQP